MTVYLGQEMRTEGKISALVIKSHVLQKGTW